MGGRKFNVLAFRLGIPYADELGHRGFSHSLAFALAVAVVGVAAHRPLRSRPLTVLTFLFVVTASHGLLDALTDGGLGVAFLWPLSPERFFAPFRMIRVAPLSWHRLLSARGAAVAISELLWVWLPCALLGAGLAFAQMRRRAAEVPWKNQTHGNDSR